MDKTYYVVMTDTFLSGWGGAKDKINKLILICTDKTQSEIVKDNAKNRTDMKHIKSYAEIPPKYLNNTKCLTQIKTITDFPCWYEKDYFKDQKERMS